MTEIKITVETVGHPQLEKINRFGEAIRKFYAEPKNVIAFEKWKKEGAAVWEIHVAGLSLIYGRLCGTGGSKYQSS